MKKYTCNYLDCKSISFQPYCMFHRNTTEYINIIVKCIKIMQNKTSFYRSFKERNVNCVHLRIRIDNIYEM